MKLFFTMLLMSSFLFSNGQDVTYKKGMIQVDGNDYLKMEVIKQNFGLTKNFEVYNLAGTKVIIAAVATEFDQDKSDNTYLFYRVTFLQSNQVGIFKVPSLSQEKGFAKLLGNSGIMVKDNTDDNKVKEFIAMKGASPKIAVDYTIVNRNTGWPLSLKADKTIEQDGKIIGSFKPTTSYNGMDYYEFKLPSGIVVAKLGFTGGNNMQNMEVFTAKDNQKRLVLMPEKDKILAGDISIDKNQFALKRVVKWLVDNKYL